MSEKFQQEDSDNEDQRSKTQFIQGEDSTQQIKRITRKIMVRECVMDRKKWPKWGEVKEYKRGQHREGDMMVETELKIQMVDGRKNDELNFVIPAPKTTFKIDLNDPKQDDQKGSDQQAQQAKQGRGIGEQITFGSGTTSSQNTWLLIISNLVYFEQANTFEEIVEVKEEFKEWVRKHLGGSEDRRDNYFINFLQNKRKNKLYPAKAQGKDAVSTQPLLQKVMLKFQQKSHAEAAYAILKDKSYGECLLCLEIQESKPR